MRSPSAQTDTPLRSLRLDVYIHSGDAFRIGVAYLLISHIELTITSITRSPSRPSTFSCTLHLDAPYAALANATIPNSSSQIIAISTDSQSTERVITANGLTQTITVNVVQVMAPVAGDVFAGPISGGNNGGRNNTNHSTSRSIMVRLTPYITMYYQSRRRISTHPVVGVEVYFPSSSFQGFGGFFVSRTNGGGKRGRRMAQTMHSESG